jgi:hypothetical protein
MAKTAICLLSRSYSPNLTCHFVRDFAKAVSNARDCEKFTLLTIPLGGFWLQGDLASGRSPLSFKQALLIRVAEG